MPSKPKCKNCSKSKWLSIKFHEIVYSLPIQLNQLYCVCKLLLSYYLYTQSIEMHNYSSVYVLLVSFKFLFYSNDNFFEAISIQPIYKIVKRFCLLAAKLMPYPQRVLWYNSSIYHNDIVPRHSIIISENSCRTF